MSIRSTSSWRYFRPGIVPTAMAQEKRVLLARPHAFIVDEMRPFLLECGYTPP